MKRLILFLILIVFCLFFLPQPAVALEPELDRPFEVEVLQNQDLLVADGGGRDWTTEGSEVFIFNKKGEVEWHFQDDLLFAHSAHRFTDGSIVITDTTNDRIIAVDQGKKEIIWTSDDWGQGDGQLSDSSHLDYPNQAVEVDQGNLLITDRNNDRILITDKKGTVIWQYKGLQRPHSASQLVDGNFLVSDSEGNRVIVIDSNGQLIWQFAGQESPLNWPRDVVELKNGNFLITDTRNHRVLEVSPEKQIVWQYKKDLYWPYEAKRLVNNNTLISDSQNRRIIEVTPEKEVVWQLRKSSPNKFSNFKNGGFEKMEQGQLEAWQKADLIAEGSGQLTVDQKIRHQGEQSARIDYQGKGHIFWLQKVKVKPGSKIDFSGWLKTDLDSNQDSWARFELWWETENGGFVDPPLVSAKSFQKTDWVKRQWSGQVPEGAVAVNIRALTTGKGTVWFDDLSWEGEAGVNKKNIQSFFLGLGAVLVSYLVFKKLNKA